MILFPVKTLSFMRAKMILYTKLTITLRTTMSAVRLSQLFRENAGGTYLAASHRPHTRDSVVISA